MNTTEVQLIGPNHWFVRIDGRVGRCPMTSHEAWLRAQAFRVGRVITAARRHLPKWLAALIGVALLIPGPQDELLVAVIIVAWLAFKPIMRRDVARAWDIYGPGSDI